MWLMMQQDAADDYVLATGETQSVRSFVGWAFEEIGISLDWQGEGVDEVGVDPATGRTLVRVDPRYFRPTEVDLLIGDPSKAERVLGWKHETSARDLAREMVRADLSTVAKEQRSAPRD